ncbi:heparan-alpha-glucosaminide N-acetyltransferase domain-containing protein [Microbacterium sp. AZCO]|uniref:heparan-alpha-glucosaminide N-acetyltransferase domain-containing protein n=1 Tax=Microbacterium sp. AZCO TaxID=3142976 RepID=UPI0031F3A7E7
MAAPAAVAEQSWFRSRWERLNGPARIAGVDLARGLAVLGMLTAHLVDTPELVPADPSTWLGVVDGRSSILFATLAGVSIGLVTGGPTPLRGAAMRTVRLRLVVRAAMLWLIGAVLIATGVPVYVILPAYAVLFVLAIPFTRLRARTVLVTAGALALVMPWLQAWLDASAYWRTQQGSRASDLLGFHYPFPVWIAFVLAGLGVARAGIRSLGVQLWMLGVGTALAVVGYGLHGMADPDPMLEPFSIPAAVWTARPHSSGLLEVIGSGGFALAVIAASLLLCRTLVRWIVLPLRAVGAMPLTAYTAQLLVWAVWAAVAIGDTAALIEFRAFEPFAPLTLGIVVGCTAWALLVGRGPLEWLTDVVTRVAVPGPPRRETAAAPVDRLDG